MRKSIINLLYALQWLLSGASLGWLIHFDVVPKEYLIIAGAILLIIIISFAVMVKRKHYVKLLLMR